MPTHTHTHTGIRIYTHTYIHKGEKDTSIWIYLYAQKRPSFLGRLGRVSFNDLYILGGREEGRGGEREGENEQGP